jgi:HSP20 family protein
MMAYGSTAMLAGMACGGYVTVVVDTIRERKAEETEEYRLHERRFGSFERRFAVPEGVDTDKIEASFENGILTLRLPKKPEAIKPEKKIEVKAA